MSTSPQHKLRLRPATDAKIRQIAAFRGWKLAETADRLVAAFLDVNRIPGVNAPAQVSTQPASASMRKRAGRAAHQGRTANRKKAA